MTTSATFEVPPCHGCNGKGWVDSMYKGAQVCPICNGTGMIPMTSTTVAG